MAKYDHTQQKLMNWVVGISWPHVAVDSQFHADMIRYHQTPGTPWGVSSYTAQLCLHY